MTGVLVKRVTQAASRVSNRGVSVGGGGAGCGKLRSRARKWSGAVACLLVLGQGRLARAADADSSDAEAAAEPFVPDRVPVLALTATAFGGAARRYGAAAVATATSALSGATRAESQWGGGVRLWGAPWERVTISAEAMRRDTGELAPSLALQVRLAGSPTGAWAFGAMGRYKAEGFAEVEGEVELGLLASLAARGWHCDLNVVAGRGFEAQETDGEALLRTGYDVLPSLQLGIEGRYRARLTGDASLAGGKSWDLVGGPEVIASLDRFFGVLMAGPTTVGVVDGVGVAGLVSIGGVM
jgi:hypothetical protein